VPPQAPPTPPPAAAAYPPPPPQYAPSTQQYAAPNAYQPLPPAASSGSGLKILFVVLAIVGVLGVMGIGAVWYGWNVVKRTAAAKGVDIDGLTEKNYGPVRRISACDLLTKEELSEIVHMNIERTEGSPKGTHSTCSYFSSAAIDNSTNAATDAIKRIQERKDTGNTTEDQEKALKEVGNIVRGMSGAASNGFVVSIEVETENPKAAMAGFKIAMAAMSGGEKNNALREDIHDVGDEAIMGPLASIFIFRKGNVSVTIDGRALSGGRDTQVAIGKRIASKL